MAGFVAADAEAAELVAWAGGDEAKLAGAVERRLQGEPLAWITGHADFGGIDVVIHPGVYVPRWQSLELAGRAADRVPDEGIAVDLCTGSGALARFVSLARPRARILATDADRRAVACARANGVEAWVGDLFDPLPRELLGAVEVVMAVPPYVPTDALRLLPRDTLAHEDAGHYDGGRDGTDVLMRVAAGATAYLRSGGGLLLEIGGDQHRVLGPQLVGLGYCGLETWADEDGDVRGIEAVWPGQ